MTRYLWVASRKAGGFPTVVSCRIAGVCSTLGDLVRRDFGPGRPDTVWAGDITYIATGQGWLHTRHTNPVRDPKPSTTRDLRLDRPLQHPQSPLHPQLPDPHKMGEPPTTTTRTSSINQVSSQQGEAHFASCRNPGQH